MKTLIAFLVTVLLALPLGASEPLPQYWNCIQIGFMNETAAVIVSDIQNGNKNPGKYYKTREKAFAKRVQKVWKLNGVYAPYCNDFRSKKAAQDFYDTIVKEANKEGLTVYPIEFKWKEADVQKKAKN